MRASGRLSHANMGGIEKGELMSVQITSGHGQQMP